MPSTGISAAGHLGLTAADAAGLLPGEPPQPVNGRLGLQMDLASGMMLEIEAYNRMVPTEDRREGVLAFNEKRKPRFKGR